MARFLLARDMRWLADDGAIKTKQQLLTAKYPSRRYKKREGLARVSCCKCCASAMRNTAYVLLASASFLSSSSRSARRRILPTLVVGNSSRNSTLRATL